MANIIKPKRSNTAAKVPTTTELISGELGVNMADRKVYINNGTAVVQVGAGNLSGLGDVAITTPSNGQALKYNSTTTKWENSSSGIGDVVGPASATDNALVRFDGATGKLIQNSTATLDDTGNMDTASVKADYFDLDTAAAAPANAVGRTAWDDGSGGSILGLKGGVVTYYTGQQEFARVYNGSGVALTKGQVVYIVGAQGNRIDVRLAQANAESTSANTIGLVAEPIAIDAEGWVQTTGPLLKLDTSTLTAGQTIYLSPTTAGAYTTTKPVAPNHLVVLGFVERISATVGSIFLKIDNGYELDELHNVNISSPTGGQLLAYDQTAGYWKNITLTDGTGISVTETAGGAITVTNTAPDQTVVLTQGGATTITGTYPNFTITSVNTTYSTATSTVPGLIELASDTAQTVAANSVTATASRTYGLQLNSAGQGVVNVPWTDTVYSLPAATSTVRGGIELGSDTAQTVASNAVTATASRSYALQVNAAGQGVVNVPWTDTVYSLPAATSTIRGGIELGSDTAQTVAANAVSATASRSYALQVNADGQGVVNVPWTDTNSGGTVTSVGGTGTVSGLTLTGTVTTSGNLTLGGTLAVTPSNFSSQTANTFLAAPNGAAGVPTFRAMVAADVPTLNQNTTGSAATLTTGRTIAMTGDVTYTSGSFNGSANVTGTATLANSGVTAGTYTKVTVNAKGLATSGTTLSASDIPELTMAKLPGAAYKQSVRCATTANITLSGTQTIDGIAVVANDRVLVKNQTTASQNGIYIVAAGAWTRSLDADAADEIGAAVVNVDSGTANGGELWTTTFKTTDTLGTTAMNWYEVLYNTGSWAISVTGSSASTTGNAATATALQTARTINGTSFNGSANITTASWGTARTLWGQSVNGSANITAPLLPAAGSAAAPAFSTSGDTNTGIYFPAADTIGFVEGGAEVMRIDSSGNVGIGTSSPGTKLDVSGNMRFSAANPVIQLNDGGPQIFIPAANTLAFATAGGIGTPTERARIDSGGVLLYGMTTRLNAGNEGALVQIKGTAVTPLAMENGDNNFIQAFWAKGTTSLCGSIQKGSGLTTSYITSSDYRAKEDVQPLTGALGRVAALKPVTYKWKIDGSNGEGFIAHELQEVCPAAVAGEKDAVDAEGNPKYQGIDTSFLVATLTAAIQEQQAIIESLKARLDAANL